MPVPGRTCEAGAPGPRMHAAAKGVEHQCLCGTRRQQHSPPTLSAFNRLPGCPLVVGGLWVYVILHSGPTEAASLRSTNGEQRSPPTSSAFDRLPGCSLGVWWVLITLDSSPPQAACLRSADCKQGSPLACAAVGVYCIGCIWKQPLRFRRQRRQWRARLQQTRFLGWLLAALTVRCATVGRSFSHTEHTCP